MYPVVLITTLLVSQAVPPSYELRNGNWLTRTGFTARTTYVANGRITLRRPARVDSIIDLKAAYVVPPFGEAHNHNIDFSTAARTDSLFMKYLRAGVFYAKNPGGLVRARDSLQGRVNKPTSVDAIFALGLLTATGGHPSGLWKRNLAGGGMTLEDGDGGFMWLIDTKADLERKWPRILAQRPDFIKTVLVYSEEYEKRRQDTTYFNWKALNPALLPDIVRRAHAANLRVSTHVETAADFHNALLARVDEINHTPGFRGDERGRLPRPEIFEVSEADAQLAAKQGVVVVTTVGGVASLPTTGPDSLRRRVADRLICAQPGRAARRRRAYSNWQRCLPRRFVTRSRLPLQAWFIQQPGAGAAVERGNAACDFPAAQSRLSR